MRQHLNAKSGYGVQVAAGIAFKSQLSQPAELLQRHQIVQCCKPAKPYRAQLVSIFLSPFRLCMSTRKSRRTYLRMYDVGRRPSVSLSGCMPSYTQTLSFAMLGATCICLPHAGISAWQEQTGFRVPIVNGIEYLLAARVSLRRLAGQYVSSTPSVLSASTSPGTGLETAKLARKLRFKSRSSKLVSMLKLQM